MFGFFSKRLIPTEQLLVDLATFDLMEQLPGLARKQADKLAFDALLKSKEIAVRDFGKDVYTKGLGENMLKGSMGAARLNAGVHAIDIVEYWNQMPLQIVFNDQFESARMSGYLQLYTRDGDMSETAKAYIKSNVRYGTTELFKPETIAGVEYTMEDAHLYPEFRRRVDIYMKNEGGSAILFGLNSTSLNAVIRGEIREGRI